MEGKGSFACLVVCVSINIGSHSSKGLLNDMADWIPDGRFTPSSKCPFTHHKPTMTTRCSAIHSLSRFVSSWHARHAPFKATATFERPEIPTNAPCFRTPPNPDVPCAALLSFFQTLFAPRSARNLLAHSYSPDTTIPEPPPYIIELSVIATSCRRIYHSRYSGCHDLLHPVYGSLRCCPAFNILSIIMPVGTIFHKQTDTPLSIHWESQG